MIAEKIDSAIIAISDLAGKMPAESWEVVSCALRELRDASKQTSLLENNVTMTGLEGAN